MTMKLKMLLEWDGEYKESPFHSIMWTITAMRVNEQQNSWDCGPIVIDNAIRWAEKNNRNTGLSPSIFPLEQCITISSRQVAQDFEELTGDEESMEEPNVEDDIIELND